MNVDSGRTGGKFAVVCGRGEEGGQAAEKAASSDIGCLWSSPFVSIVDLFLDLSLLHGEL